MPHLRTTSAREFLRRPLTVLALAAACATAVASTQWRVTSMKPGSDGAAPGGQLLAMPDGTLYGTAQEGGSSHAGTVFVVNPQGRISTLHEFNGSDGYAPVAGLTLGKDGMLYGTTSLGAANGLGGVFRIATDGTFTLLHSFDSGNDAGTSNVHSALALGPDGNFYGTGPLSAGYPEHNGTVFKVTPAGDVTILHVFDTRAREPDAGVTFAPDGRLYGTVAKDGRKDCGILYSLAADGSDFRLEHQFDHRRDGCHPISSMIVGTDGLLYGTTQYGGPKGGVGTLYRFDTSTSQVQVLHIFHDDDPAGSDPSAGVSLAPNGRLYGATSFGSNFGNGSVYQASEFGKITVLHAFAGNGSEGQGAQAAPVPDGAGHVAGSLLNDGVHEGGTVYRVKTAIPK